MDIFWFIKNLLFSIIVFSFYGFVLSMVSSYIVPPITFLLYHFNLSLHYWLGWMANASTIRYIYLMFISIFPILLLKLYIVFIHDKVTGSN